MFELIDIFSRGGGGGSGGSGGGGGIIAIPILIGSAILTWWIRKKRIQKARANQAVALAADETWHDDIILDRASKVFHSLQRDWSNFDVENMSHYTTPRYHSHLALMMTALRQMNRRNEVRDPVLRSVTLFGVEDNTDDELDRFNVEIRAAVFDRLYNDSTGDELYSSMDYFTEIWHFEREKDLWMLDNITQINTDRFVTRFDPVIDTKYHQFAEANGFFYNADFGWLLLPLYGVLFSESRFGRSDINHHVIGAYNRRVIQFFEYEPIIRNKITLKEHLTHLWIKRVKLTKYTVAQVTLPKSYGNIIIRRNSLFGLRYPNPRKMIKVVLEWPKFNKLFTVYATDAEKATSLELLHPAFMEQLGGLKFRVNIEVVGDNLYLYTTDKRADYSVMLDILKEAFDEVKM